MALLFMLRVIDDLVTLNAIDHSMYFHTPKGDM
jgi:hypothetical protein